MKNKFRLIQPIAFFIALFMVVSCDKDFIEEPVDTTGVTDALIFSSRENAQTFVNGILANYKGQYRGVDAGGLYAMYFARAVKGNDIIQDFSFYTFDYGHENREPNYRRTNFTIW